jgi:hypothetical protein
MFDDYWALRTSDVQDTDYYHVITLALRFPIQVLGFVDMI